MSFPRYPSYKDSGVEWLGEVPEHWSQAPLKNLLDIQNGSDYKAVEAEQGYTVIGSGGAFAFASQYHYDGESVLLGRKGTIDRPLYVKERFWAVDTMYWSKIRDGAHGKFTFYVSQCIPFQYYSTNTALPSMTKTLLGGHIIAVPSLSEQVAIAAFLDHETAKIDALIAEQQRLIELLQEKRQAVISHAVTKGLNPDAPMRDSGVEWLGEVPEHWEVKRLKQISSQISVGIVVEPSKYYDDSGNVPALRSLNVKPGRIDLADCVYISGESNRLLKKSVLRSGDLVIVRSGQPGTCAVIPEELDKCNCIDLIFLRAPDRGSSQYLMQQLSSESARYQYGAGAEGAIQQHFNVKTASELVIAWPPPREQEEICQYLSSRTREIDSLSEHAEYSVSLLQERRSALISAAVTGQIDVRGLVPEASAA